jgi:hypothetical protein
MPTTLLLTVDEYQARWDRQRPGTLEGMTEEELGELYAELTSLPLGG